MWRALELAARGQGRVEPNPMVGCVIVKNGRVVGEGFHRRYGGPHAEINALKQAAGRARGATMYVTLEPCCHFGKTPPCTDAVMASGLRRVVAAMPDPNPKVSGKGLARLRASRIDVRVGLLREEARRLVEPFIVYQTLHRPYLILKWAQSIDGKIATRTGDSKWITSLESRREAHRIRARVDAVVAGVETVLADDPDLTARLVRPVRQATRIILDSRLRTPPTARVVRTARKSPTLIATGPQGWSLSRRRRGLDKAGCEVVQFPIRNGGVDLKRLASMLHSRGMTNVLVEGGGKVLGQFLQLNLADEAMVFVAPRLIGGETAPGPLRNLGPAKVGSETAEVNYVQAIGPDLCYNLSFRR